MKPLSFVFFLLFLLSFLLSFFLGGCTHHEKQVVVAVQQEAILLAEYPDNPFEVVNQFCEHFILSTDEKPGAQLASGYLSEKRLLSMEPYTGSMMTRLIEFAGVQNIPDQGFHIMGVIDITDDQAWVETRWNYSDHYENPITVRTFYLIKENSYWKIEEIQ